MKKVLITTINNEVIYSPVNNNGPTKGFSMVHNADSPVDAIAYLETKDNKLIVSVTNHVILPEDNRAGAIEYLKEKLKRIITPILYTSRTYYTDKSLPYGNLIKRLSLAFESDDRFSEYKDFPEDRYNSFLFAYEYPLTFDETPPFTIVA
jgi:hypothetical protein